ncbi:SusD/RagB family nutrient-binding outer membrane lipoprotein [Phocaeicola plebeius]|uniref:SusD/RagB family nutrient-binding outer membrane lipoprotein n=1 Tax=Phocaeicola plebeius TaxID=310297 RepID=UPI002942D3D6|nr:SusD/RagB family nutrient-binding outer membrane lipoprotein [Phocaeicola plebeius]MBS1436192.1 SusD/RagB family nutrient-binding outer membrane lipoprotein [Bacteroides sp.]
MKKIYSYIASSMMIFSLGAFSSCSDSYLEDVNTDDSKASIIDPNAQLTTALLQTYGDFSLMDTYRSYITGFTQYYAGGWNVSNYAGAVYPKDSEMALLWNRYYSISIKNLVDAIYRSEDMPNTNAALRIHRAYMMALLSDIYGDIPCSEAGMSYINGNATPKYDTQEEVYNFVFSELKAAAAQLGTGTDLISGDVTSLESDVTAWKRYANTLRLRYAMRISDVAPEKAREEFESALTADGGIISSGDEDAYVKYIDAPFTLYDGANDLDFRANALGEMIYGQDPKSPSFVCSTLYKYMETMNDPRLYRIARCYIHTTRSQTDTSGNYDVTDEVIAWGEKGGLGIVPCNVGDAWWSDWVNAPATSDIPTLANLVSLYPEKGYDQNDYPARMIRPTIAVAFCNADCPGILITYAEVEFLLAEAASKGWNVSGSAESHYEEGIRASMQMMNNYYDIVSKISDDEINDYIAANPLGSNPRESINTQAWILHLTNPSEGWANLRRSDYPAIADRTLLPVRTDFPREDPNMQTPTRLRYPLLESKYNSVNNKAAVDRMGGNDNWHTRVWWDIAEQNFIDIENFGE